MALKIAQVKKLQVMLRQANDQLEKAMRDRQELEESLKRSAEDSSQQVRALAAEDTRVSPSASRPGGSRPQIAKTSY